MKTLLKSFALLTIIALFFSCNTNSKKEIDISEVAPWCIVTFDKLQRTPEQRIAMLKEFGFTKYGYNWREKNLVDTKKEFALAKENNIDITSTLVWLNPKRDSIGKLSPRNQKMLSILKETDNKPIVWVSFSDSFFKKLNQVESIELAINFIKYVKPLIDDAGCKMALYNHRGWFGNPFNQVAILQQLAKDDIHLKMAYNFHHAHHFTDEFDKVVKAISPYIYHINLNGMKKDGPEILTLGAGDLEAKMINTLLENGYKGSWGILGHINEEDVQQVIDRNIKGYKTLMTSK